MNRSELTVPCCVIRDALRGMVNLYEAPPSNYSDFYRVLRHNIAIYLSEYI